MQNSKWLYVHIKSKYFNETTRNDLVFSMPSFIKNGSNTKQRTLPGYQYVRVRFERRAAGEFF